MTKQDLVNLVRIKVFGVDEVQADLDARINLYINLAHFKLLQYLIKVNPVTAKLAVFSNAQVENKIISFNLQPFAVLGFYEQSNLNNPISYSLENGVYKTKHQDSLCIYMHCVLGERLNGDNILLPLPFHDLLLTQTLIDASVHEHLDSKNSIQYLEKQLNKRLAEFFNVYGRNTNVMSGRGT